MTIIQADILKWAAQYTGPKFHALLSDPPYHLTERPRVAAGGFGGQRTDEDKALRKGFMGKDWDGGDIAFRPETWAALAEHLYPGAWGMAFAGSRGWHRMAVAIEDAGLIMQPTMFGWSYGSGFPKATRIDTQIDAAAFRAWLKLHPEEQARLKAAREAERSARRRKDSAASKEARAELAALTAAYKAAAGLLPDVIGVKKHQPKFAAAELGYREKDNGYNSRERETFDLLDCATEAARHWLGHRYGGQALKPALEPIIVFQKPYTGSPLRCLIETGAGALWIDGGRIAGDVPQVTQGAHDAIYGNGRGLRDEPMVRNPHPAGRWPSNLILAHLPACNGTCAPGCAVAALGQQSGEIAGGRSAGTFGGIFGTGAPASDSVYDDHGTAARFFYNADWMYERIELADAIQYVAKASRAEREAGLDPRQTAIMRLLDDGDEWEDFSVGKWSDGRNIPADYPKLRDDTSRRNTHPTIKPISLTRYLATLLLPPAEYGPRRLLVPFAGAGSEVIGADLAGWEEVTGIELEADHVAIAEVRREYWKQRRWELGDPARKLTVRAAPAVPAGQVDMFAEIA